MLNFYKGALLIGYVCFTTRTNGVDYKGFCAFPCARQDRGYGALSGIFDINMLHDISVYNRSDPTIILFYRNGSIDRVYECMMRSGPFIMLRQEIEGNTTHSQYRCNKVIGDSDGADILTIYLTDWKVFEDYPSICDVCTGEGYFPPLVIKDVNVECKVDMGCNVPIVCPVINPEVQIRCSCEDENLDSGFCCPGLE